MDIDSRPTTEGARILCYRINSSIEYNLLKNGQSARKWEITILWFEYVSKFGWIYILSTRADELWPRAVEYLISLYRRVLASLPSSFFSSFFPSGSSLVVGSRTNGSRKMAIGFSIIPINISPMMRTVCQ